MTMAAPCLPTATAEEDSVSVGKTSVPRFTDEFWTAKQRQGNAIHEVSYRACFKPQLPRFFIERLTGEGDVVYDPFSGRGTTPVEAALSGRRIISNDVNPLGRIMCEGRLYPPRLDELAARLDEIPVSARLRPGMDLSMFYDPKTLAEILSLRSYLRKRREAGEEDGLDKWIRVVATNRLSGHSSGFFSVYTLPPNQAATPDRQLRINRRLKQSPGYRDTKAIILRKTERLTRNLSPDLAGRLNQCAKTAVFLEKNAADTDEIPDNSVALTVTSPPFLDVVDYARDNWLRCWFNHVNVGAVCRQLTRSGSVAGWRSAMLPVFGQLFRVTRRGGWVAFEVGEVRNGSVRLDEHVAEIGTRSGLRCAGIMVNAQKFTKTANIWGVSNNRCGTNTNRIVLLTRE